MTTVCVYLAFVAGLARAVAILMRKPTPIAAVSLSLFILFSVGMTFLICSIGSSLDQAWLDPYSVISDVT